MADNKIIDLSKLPPPQVIEPVDFEATLAEMKADIITSAPETKAALALESSVLSKFLERSAYWLMGRTQKENEDANAVMLAYATGADLEHLGADYGVERLTIVPEDTSTTPPTPAVMESNDDLRRRIQLAPKSFSVAGPVDAYVFYTLSADGRVRDAVAYNPSPGIAAVTVLSREDNGQASQELIDMVDAALNAKYIRPLTDLVQISSAVIVPYEIKANIYILPGPDTGIVFANVQASIAAYVESIHSIGTHVPISGLMAAMHIDGVEKVELIQPTAEVTVNENTQAAFCTAIDLTAQEAQRSSTP